MVINVTHSYYTSQYVDIIERNGILLLQVLPSAMQTRGDMIGKLRSFLSYIREHGSAYIYGKCYTGVSIRKLSELYGGTWRTWEKYIHAWIEWGLLGIPNHSSSENNIFEINAMDYARDSGYPHATTMYTVTAWTAEQLRELQPISGAGTKASVIHRRGKAEADRIYGDRRGISPAQQRAEKAILRRIARDIARRGYSTRESLREIRTYYTGQDGKRHRVKMDPVFDSMRSELEKEYSYHPPTAEERQRLQLTGRGWILTERDNAPEARKKTGAEG